MDTNNVWLITGASKGLGLTLTRTLLAQGHKVAATSRDRAALIRAIGTPTDHFLPLEVDLLNEKSVQQAIAMTIDTFQSIDVLVNNAGYGHFGTVEELSDAEARSNFDTNVFGSLNFVRNVMPYMRKQQSGRIFNISSIGGYTAAFPGWGIYCATKFAVTAFTEALAMEAKPFGIHATVIYPGYFRTEFLSKESMILPKNPIDAYADARASQQAHEVDINGNQPGDPEKAAAAMIRLSQLPEPPLHLFLGQDAYAMAQDKIASVQADMQQYEALTRSTDFALEQQA